MTTQRMAPRVAFVGAGAMARAHVNALRHLESSVEIAGVYDADPGVAAEFAALAQTRAYPSFDALLATARPDVVHVCTPPTEHYSVARRALEAGAHVYVEKPVATSAVDAASLLALAADQGKLVCGGHQLLADPVYGELLRRSRSLGSCMHVESRFLFHPPSLRAGAAPEAFAAQLMDIVPHPLYSLVEAMQRMAPFEEVTLTTSAVSPTEVDAVFRAGRVTGRLFVSLRARPVASTLLISGERGALQADFIRGTITGVTNPGTTPLEKVFNPVLDGLGQVATSIVGVARRLRLGSYPGLVEMFTRFYAAVVNGGPSPTTPGHLRVVAALQEELAINVFASAGASRNGRTSDDIREPVVGQIVAITGAAGMLGRAVARELAESGYHVRGVGRGPNPRDASIHSWVRADLSTGVPANAFEGATLIVHAAAATSGGFPEHLRHSVVATDRVLAAALAAGVNRLIHVSSLSVLEPPHSRGEMQNERTPLAFAPRTLGPYTWGKHESETRVAKEAARAGMALRIIRPGALVDWNTPELPGLVGRRLFGNWHLGLGRPGLPIAVCGLDRAASAIAWCVKRFNDSPPLLNLIDPEITTRAQLLSRMRRAGWTGRTVWVPISLLALGVTTARALFAALKRRRAEPLAVWQVLRPRRFDTTASKQVITSATRVVRHSSPTMAMLATSDDAVVTV